MTIHIKSTIRNAMLAAIAAAADSGSGPAVIELRNGAQPANADAADAGTLLATFTCAAAATFETPASGVMDLDANPDLSTTGAAGGTASWARMKDSDGHVIFDGSVGVAGSGADWTITSTTIVLGQTTTLTLGSLTQPA